MSKRQSNKTEVNKFIVMLLVLAIILSVISRVVTLNIGSGLSSDAGENTDNSNAGVVKFEVLENPNSDNSDKEVEDETV